MMMNNNTKLSAIAATGVAGVITGCLSFVSFVDVRSFFMHLNNTPPNTKLIQDHFPIWWPNGRDLMVPLLTAGTLMHGNTYWQTNNRNWLVSGLLIMLIGPYTGIVLGEDIETLRHAKSEEVASTATRFCNLHHFRLIMAMSGFTLSLFSLADL